jgi:hypothetical protein
MHVSQLQVIKEIKVTLDQPEVRVQREIQDQLAVRVQPEILDQLVARVQPVTQV